MADTCLNLETVFYNKLGKLLCLLRVSILLGWSWFVKNNRWRTPSKNQKGLGRITFPIGSLTVGPFLIVPPRKKNGFVIVQEIKDTIIYGLNNEKKCQTHRWQRIKSWLQHDMKTLPTNSIVREGKLSYQHTRDESLVTWWNQEISHIVI